MIETGNDTVGMLAPALAEHGASVRSVGTVMEAFAALDANPPDLMFARVQSDDESAFAVIREMRLRDGVVRARVAAVAVGPAGEPDACVQAVASGFDDCLVEPLEHARLVEMLERTAASARQPVRAKAVARAHADVPRQPHLRPRRPAAERRDGDQPWRFMYAPDTNEEPDNQLLGALPSSDFERIAPHLELVALPQNRVLVDIGDELTHVYFLRSGMASRLVAMRDGATVEASVIGRDGMAGVNVCLGSTTSQFRFVMQVRGVGFRMPAAACRDAFDQIPAFRRTVMRYAAALDTHTAIVAACNRLHTAEQRLARWLLLARELAGTSELPVTQELLSGALGVRRVGVTIAAGALKKDGLIEYSWGQLRILRPADLEARACECYARLKPIVG